MESLSKQQFMKQFTLDIQYKITGIGATSGLILLNNSLFIISDNSSFLYEYLILENQLNKIKLDQNSQENTIKKDKLDFEAITLNDNKLYLFGSGSTKKRENRYSFDLKSKEIKHKDLSKIYQKLKQNIGISDDELNIEGAFFIQKKLYLFQRGNGDNSQNGIFVKDENKNINFTKITLPKIQEIEAAFTDAILIDDKIYFLAAVENTTSTYNDGEILGSFIGCLALNSFELQFCQQISETHKFEGLTFYSQSENNINFLLCEDNDTEELQTNIYKLSLKN